MRDNTPHKVRNLAEERGLRRLDQAITELDAELRRVADEDDLTRIARATGVYREAK